MRKSHGSHNTSGAQLMIDHVPCQTDAAKRSVALVLGAAGFIGRHVSLEFACNGWLVKGVGHGDWNDDEQAAWGITRWTRADISLESLEAAIENSAPSVIVHCAGNGSVATAYSQPYGAFDKTVGSTASALEFARTHGRPGCRVVLISSAAVYGDQGEVDCTEASTRSPISPYGFNKVAAETACDSYSRFFGVPCSVVRLFSVYGEGLKKQLLWDALGKLSRGEYTFFGTGHELRDWIHVEDASRLLFLAATQPQSDFDIYNAGNAHATTRDVLIQLSRAAGSEILPSFNGETHVGNPRRLTANCKHSRWQLDWLPRIDLAEGLNRYAKWHLEQS